MTFFWEGGGGRTFERGWTLGLSLPSWTFVQYPLPGQYILMWIANVLDVMQMEERAESMSREPITWCFPRLLYRHNLLVLFFFLKNSSHYHPSPASCSQAQTCTSQESFSQLQLPALLWFPGLAVKRTAEMPSLRGHFTSLCKGFKIKVRAKQRK